MQRKGQQKICGASAFAHVPPNDTIKSHQKILLYSPRNKPMRSRVASATAVKAKVVTRNDDDDVEEAAIKSSSFNHDENNNFGRKWSLFCVGVFLGILLTLSLRPKEPPIALQTFHRSVESAYRAHKKAKQDYLKAYREAYLESVLDSSSGEKTKLCWEKPDEKFCWNQGLTIEEHVEAQLHPWISKGGITPKDVESTRSVGCGVIRTDGSMDPPSFLPYIGRALKAYPELWPKAEICIHEGFGDWPEASMDRYTNTLDGLPLLAIGSSYEAFLEILFPWSYGGRDAFGERYENDHRELLERGTKSPEWSQKKNTAVWRGSVGCSVGCADRGHLYFPSNHIEQCSDDHTDGGWDANKAGRTWGCDQSEASLRHQRIQLANMSFHRGEECGLDAHITKFNEHEGTLRKFLTSEDLENLQAAGLGEEEQARYKYVVNIQNNGFADRMWRILALKVVVLQEMHAFREFFYDMLIPWVHYVPIKTDLSDLCEKIQWLKDNDEKARDIAENAHAFVRDQLSLDNINLYVATLVHRIGELTVQGHNFTEA